MPAMKATLIAAAALIAGTVALSAQTSTIRIHAAKVVDGTGKVLKNATIVVQGSKITVDRNRKRRTRPTISDNSPSCPA